MPAEAFRLRGLFAGLGASASLHLLALLRRLRRIKKSPPLPTHPSALHRKLGTFTLSPSLCEEAFAFACLPPPVAEPPRRYAPAGSPLVSTRSNPS